MNIFTALVAKIFPYFENEFIPASKKNNLLVLLINRFNTISPDWFENIIIAFHDFDPNSTSFRYGTEKYLEEMVVNLSHLKELMGLLSESFQKINRELKSI